MFHDEAATLAPENRLTSQPTTAISGSLDGQSAPRQLPISIGRYRIIRLLGEGGMGAVYEAEQDQPRRRVALKVIKAAWASPELLHRFEQEFQALGRLHHPGIAQIYEAGTADTGFGFQPFFAMELIDGKPLGAYAEPAPVFQPKLRSAMLPQMRLAEVAANGLNNALARAVLPFCLRVWPGAMRVTARLTRVTQSAAVARR